MAKYLLRRILLFIPTLLIISLFTFFISINAPGDPVDMILNPGEGNENSHVQKFNQQKEYAELRHKMGFDLPVFYFSLTDATVSDTLYKIADPDERATLKRLSNEYGSWENVSAYYLSLKELEQSIYLEKELPQNTKEISKIKELINQLLELKITDSTKNKIIALNKCSYGLYDNDTCVNHFVPAVSLDVQDVDLFLRELISEKNSYRKYIPVVHWYGFNNQYHHWLVNFLTGDFGISYHDKRSVKDSVFEAIPRTLGISLTSILLAYLIAIPLGVHSAIKKGTRNEKTITTTLFVLYSLPNFWIATMLVIFLCGGDYFSWFPAPGSSPIPDGAPLWYKMAEGAYRLILPLFCWTYGSLAFISRQMRGGILQSITQDYIQTARAKGLDEKKIIWKHALKNSLLPVITLFASIFPLAISGSFVIENIFNIPGMGKLSLDALYTRDYPIIFTVMMFTAILTLLGNLVSDVLYAVVDPRISYSKKP